jgi:hypothetical protein
MGFLAQSFYAFVQRRPQLETEFFELSGVLCRK